MRTADQHTSRVSFVVNVMFETAGREVPLALCLHTPQ